MSSNPFADNPYEAGGENKSLPAFARRPGALTAISVLAIILGFLSLGASCNTVLAIAVNQAGGFQGFMQPGAAGANKMQEIQAEMYEEMAVIGGQYLGLKIVIILLLILIGAAMLIGGFGTMRLREKGRKLLATTFGVAIVFELLRAILTIVEQARVMAVMQLYTERMTNEIPETEVAEFMEVIVKISGYTGVVFGIGWLALKLGFFIFGLLYLRKESVRNLFETAPPR